MTAFIMPSGVKSAIQTLQDAGYEAYIVGGCVRDMQLGILPHDWDICTSATPEQMKAIFNHTVDTGPKHGTVTVISDDGQYEITTFRKDGLYSDNRRPDSVEFVSDLKEDLSRRDFTVNAMAYNESTGLVDYFGGTKDLENKIIKCVGNPTERFQEDALRILRALRFASRYGFRIEQNTAEAIRDNADLLHHISSERIREELCGILSGANCARVLLEYDDIIPVVLPEIKSCIGFEQNNKYHCYDVYEHMVRSAAAYRGKDAAVRFALFIHDIGKPQCYTEDERGGHFHGHAEISYGIAKQIVARLKFDSKTAKAITDLVSFHDINIAPTAKSVRKWLNKIGEERLFQLLEVKMADIAAHEHGTQDKKIADCKAVYNLACDIIVEGQCFSLKDLAVNGNDIIELGIEEGKEVGQILNELLEAVINGDASNDKEELLDLAETIRDKDTDKDER